MLVSEGKNQGGLAKIFEEPIELYKFIKNFCKTPLVFSFGDQHPFFLFFNVSTVYCEYIMKSYHVPTSPPANAPYPTTAPPPSPAAAQSLLQLFLLLRKLLRLHLHYNL